MSFTACRDQVVSMIEAITGLATDAGWLPTFAHLGVNADVALGVDARTFWFEFERGAMKGNVTIAPPRALRFRAKLRVRYPLLPNPTLLYELIAGDYSALMGTLADLDDWNQPTSTIESLFEESEGETDFGEFNIEIDDERGQVDLVIEMLWEVRP